MKINLNWPPNKVVVYPCEDKKTLKDYMEIKAEDTISKNYQKEERGER